MAKDHLLPRFLGFEYVFKMWKDVKNTVSRVNTQKEYLKVLEAAARDSRDGYDLDEVLEALENLGDRYRVGPFKQFTEAMNDRDPTQMRQAYQNIRKYLGI